MGNIRTLSAVVEATSGTPTPIYTGTPVVAASFSITNNIATIVLGSAIPKVGYHGARFDLGITSGGDQVTLWGFTTATYFNGLIVTVLDHNDAANSFRFYFTHANVASTADTGNTAPAPVDPVRSVRLECDPGNSTNLIYVGDSFVSSSRWVTVLSLAGQIAYEIFGDTIPANRIFIDGSASSSCSVHVSLIY